MKTRSILEICRSKEMDSGRIGPLVLDYLDSLAKIEDDALQKTFLKELVQDYVLLEKRVDALLKNTLPEAVAEEIKYEDRFSPREYDCTILFSDFVGFTRLAEKVPPELLIETLDHIFSAFDGLLDAHKGTKIKTIGDAYMAVFGAPEAYAEHPLMAVRAAVAMQRFMEDFNLVHEPHFEMRVGIHTGLVMAGVVGRERMQFDVFGDNVNIASRFESSGQGGRINVSEETYSRTRHHFHYQERGMITLKNKPQMRAYFVAEER